MTVAYFITSAIEVSDSPLTYSNNRSVFSSEERLRQTIMTIASLDQVSDSETTIYLLDMSSNSSVYKDIFSYQKNLKFISVKDEFSEIYKEVTTHPNKSRSETLLTSEFLKKYRGELITNDAIVKLSGRYFLDSSFNPNVLNKDKIFFKYPMSYQWQDWWGYDAVRLDNSQILNQYCSVVLGWGSNHYDTMLSLYYTISEYLSRHENYHYDIETLLYFYTRQYVEHIVETNWTVYGWLAPTGQFVRY
jgi:hypothetical protein